MHYSNFICSSCADKLKEVVEFQNDLIEKQTKLYHLFEHKEPNNDSVKNELQFVKVECDPDIPDPDFDDPVMIFEDQSEPKAIPKKSSMPEPEFNCTICGELFKMRTALINHIKMIHFPHQNIAKPEKKTGKYSMQKNMCSICARMIKGGQTGLKEHMLRAHTNSFNFFCDFCPKKMKLKRDMVAHLKIHIKPEFREKFSCEICGRNFVSAETVRNHVKTIHQPELPKTIECYCGKFFKTPGHLKFHQKQIHGIGTFPCEKCDKVYETKHRLMDHVRHIHAAKYPCEVCGELIGGSRKLRHMKKHGEAEFKCSHVGCTREFYDNYSLKNHITLKHETDQKFICTTCGSAFQALKYLKKHVQRQHEGEEMSCQVKACSFSCRRRDYLLAHYRKHDIDEVTAKKMIEQGKKSC